MKKILILCLLLLPCRLLKAQINLVPNPSFEDTVFCTWDYCDNIFQVSDWFVASATPDYANTYCSVYPIPNFFNQSFIYYQYPHSGSSFINMIWSMTTASTYYREIVGCKLNSPLKVGQSYIVSFYYNAYTFPNYLTSSNDQGVLFSTREHNQSKGDSTFYKGNFKHKAHLSADSINRDTANWTHFQKSFIADSAYTYLYLGNFYDSAHTLKDNWPVLGSGNFYDDVSVVLDSSNSENNITELSNDVKIYPNPAQNTLTVESNFEINKIEIYSSIGFIINQTLVKNNKTINLDIKEFREGLYFLKVFMNGTKTYTQNIIKN